VVAFSKTDKLFIEEDYPPCKKSVGAGFFIPFAVKKGELLVSLFHIVLRH